MVCEVDCLKQSLHQDDLKSLESLPVEAVRIVNRICLSVSFPVWDGTTTAGFRLITSVKPFKQINRDKIDLEATNPNLKKTFW